jgi:hypothetical protein
MKNVTITLDDEYGSAMRLALACKPFAGRKAGER